MLAKTQYYFRQQCYKGCGLFCIRNDTYADTEYVQPKHSVLIAQFLHPDCYSVNPSSRMCCKYCTLILNTLFKFSVV